MNDFVLGNAEELPDLAAKINATVKAADENANAACEQAMQAGELLRQAKTLVAHGDWITWLTENCEVKPRTAQVYMRLSSVVPTLQDSNAQRVAHLPVREAIRAITTSPQAPVPLSRSQRRVSTRSTLARSAKHLNYGNTAVSTVALWESVAKDVRPNAAAFIRSKLTAAIEAVSPAQVEKMRKKLSDALAALDALAPRTTA